MKNKIKVFFIFIIVSSLFTACGSNGLETDVNKESSSIQQVSENESTMNMEQKLQALKGLVEGDVFKDYVWKGPFYNASDYQRVTDLQAGNVGAKKFLPNPKNKITIDDLECATKVELIIEMWGGHAGTTGKTVRLNENEWLPVPESEYVGESKHENYYQFRYPTVSIPLDHLKEGENLLEFNCTGQLPDYSNNWPQWGVYSVVFRVYYDQEKPHITGNLSLVDANSTISDGHTFGVAVEGELEKIQRVDYVGFYEDFDYNGDGIYNEWQCTYKYGEMKNHIGSSNASPFSVRWDSEWVPDQESAIKLAAIITNTDGVSYVTNPLEGIKLERDKRSVVMYKSYGVAPVHGVRDKKSMLARMDIDDELTKAIEAKVTIVTWNGAGTAVFSLNNNTLSETLGENHDYGIDVLPVPLDFIKKGTNFVILKAVPAEQNEHGVEVMWPGASIKIMYEK